MRYIKYYIEGSRAANPQPGPIEYRILSLASGQDIESTESRTQYTLLQGGV